MERLIYKDDDTIISQNVTDLDSDGFLEKCIRIMQMLGYNNNHIKKALDEATVD